MEFEILSQDKKATVITKAAETQCQKAASRLQGKCSCYLVAQVLIFMQIGQ